MPPIYVMAKPAGPVCNLACEYCYYLEKQDFVRGKQRMAMSDETLELYIRQYIECQPGDDVGFVWHGGEPSIRPLDFYRRVLALQKKYAGAKRISNSFQTNGTLLNDEWCRFFRENGWLVGLSLDGPAHLHDYYRLDKSGHPTFLRVMKAAKLLDRYGVEWNAMATVNAANADRPIEFYSFFKKIGCRFIQFTPVVERIDETGHLLPGYAEGGEIADFSVTPEQWGNFLISVFDEWVKNDVGEYFVQIFDATLANWMQVEPGLCTLSSHCGHAAVMEHDGDIYSCDHFVFPQYRLGNIHEQTILEMMLGDRQRDFAKAKGSALPASCRGCRWLFACHGECPRNRFPLPYLCEGYKRFFEHTAPYMDYMRRELEAGRPASNVMKMHD